MLEQHPWWRFFHHWLPSWPLMMLSYSLPLSWITLWPIPLVYSLSLQSKRTPFSFLCLCSVRESWEPSSRPQKAHWLYAIFSSLQDFPIHTDNGLNETGRWVWSASWFLKHAGTVLLALYTFFMSRTVACWLFVLNTWKFHVVQTILRYWSWDQIRREKKNLFFSYTAGTKSEESEVDFLTFVPLKKKQFVRLLPFRGEKSGFVSNSVMIEENESHIWIRHSVLHFLV